MFQCLKAYMKKTYILFLLLQFHFHFVKAQTIGTDSRGKEIFNFYKTKSLSIPITASTSSAKINYTFKVGKGTQYYVSRFNDKSGSNIVDSSLVKWLEEKKSYSSYDSLRFTMAKSTGLNLSLGIGNILSNLTKASTFHPNYTLSVGIGRNIDIFNNWDNIKTLRFPFYTWNVNAYGSLDNLIIYDTTSITQERRHPISKGIIAEGTLFLPKINNLGIRLIAISSSINYEKGNNISSLKNFQKNSPTYSNAEVISLSDYIGKLGDLKDEDRIRGRLSIPIFPKAIKFSKNESTGKFTNSLQLSIIPYYTIYGIRNSQYKHLAGIYLNASQGQNLFTRNSTIVSGFGIGSDWAISHGFSDNSIFVAGSLDLHSLFAHKKPNRQ